MVTGTNVDFDERHYLNDELKEMFFKLDLIQSYGSGVRHAKKAMEDNKSPRLVYSPDNDTDDYTQVVAYINEEFARIQEEENRQAGSGKTAGEEELLSDDERSLKEVLKGVLKEAHYKKVLPIVELIDTQGAVTPSEAKEACGKSYSTTWERQGMVLCLLFYSCIRLSKREKEPPPVSPVSKMFYGISNVKVPCLPQNSLFVNVYEQMFTECLRTNVYRMFVVTGTNVRGR